MIFKHSLKTLVRTPFKTILFFLLIAVVTCSSTLGISMFSSSQNMLQSAEQQYKTVAKLEYTGENYPTYTAYDSRLDKVESSYDFTKIEKLPYVKSVERTITMRGYTPGWKNMRTQSPTKDLSVVIFRVREVTTETKRETFYTEYTDPETGDILHSEEIREIPGETVAECMSLVIPYSYQYEKTQIFKIINHNPLYLDGSSGLSLYEEGHVYIANGTFTKDMNQLYFEPHDFDPQALTDDAISKYIMYDTVNGIHGMTKEERLTLFRNGYGYGIFTKIHEVHDITDEWEAMEMPSAIMDSVDRELWETQSNLTWKDIFTQASDAYDVMNNSVNVIATDDCSAASEFQYGDTYITDGRFFEPSDGSHAVVVSEFIANQLGIQVGDTMELNLHSARRESDFYNSYFPTVGFLNEGDNEYTVVGIYKHIDGYEPCVYIPYSATEPLFSGDEAHDMPLSYQLATITVENGRAVDFEKAAEKVLANGMKLTVFDQGYTYAERTFSSMRSTSVIILAGCLVVGLSTLLLFAHLFVSKQKESLEILLSLGAGEGRGFLYLISGVAMLSLIAIAIGAVGGYMLSGRVLWMAYQTADANTLNTAYSAIVTRPESIDNILRLSPSIPMTLIAFFGLFALTNALCLIFARRVLVGERADESKTPAAARRRFNHTFKHAFRSMRRNVGRSLIVPAVSLFIAALLMIYGQVMANYEDRVRDLYDSAKVDGHYISINGRMKDGLLLDGEMIETIWESGDVDRVDASFSVRYKMMGVVKFADGTVPDNVDELYLEETDNAFTMELAAQEIQVNWSKLTFTSDLETVPDLQDFEPVAVYMDGYDEDTLKKSDENVCLIPFSFAEENNLEFGDTIRLAYAIGRGSDISYTYFEYKIVGYYSSENTGTVGVFSTAKSYTIYAPIRCGTLQSFYLYPDAFERLAQNQYQGFGFYYTINESGKIEEHADVFYGYDVYSDDVTGAAGLLTEELGLDADTAPYTYFPRLHSIRFTLKSGEGVLDHFKSYIDRAGIGSQNKIGSTRTAVVINDDALIQSVDGTQKVIDYMRILYPVLFVIIIAISFVVSYLLTRTRRDELAIMRSSGAGVIKTFFAFFIEQMTLCTLGTVIGVGILWAILGSITSAQAFSILIYFGCYVVGVTLACFVMSRGNVLKLLSANE